LRAGRAETDHATFLAEASGFETGGKLRKGSDDGLLEFCHLVRAMQWAGAPERSGEFKLTLGKAGGFITALIVNQQQGAVVWEAIDFPW
jgi:hypothetical protein